MFHECADRASQCPIISSIEQIQSMQLLNCFKQEYSPRIHVQQRYYVDGLHVSPSVVPRVFAALHEAGVLEGAALWRESSQKLFLIQYNIMPLGQKSQYHVALRQEATCSWQTPAFWALTHDRCEKRLNI